MSTSILNKKFDGDYLDRYRKGELSAREAHELEKASLEDPLLAEALEGFYSSSRSSRPELNFLKLWVNERIEENQSAIRFIPKRRSYAPMLRVAAVVLVLVGASWMGYFFWINPTQPLLADNKSDQPEVKQSSPFPLTESGQTTPATNDALPVPPAPPSSNRTDEVVATPADKKEVVAQPIVEQPPVSVREAVVTDAPVPFAETAKAPPKLVEDQAVTEKDDYNRNETSKVESVTSTAAATKRLAADVSKSSESSTPSVGWNAYEAYLDRNRVSAPTASNTITTHLVELSFEIGKDGRPTDIRVERSAGSFYDEKAIELLKKGPGWIPGKSGKRAELQVRF